MDLCSYGCGNKAVTIFKNGAKCCSRNVNGCPTKRKKDSITKKGKFCGVPFWKMPNYQKGTKIAWNKGMKFAGDERWKGSGAKSVATKKRKGISIGGASTPEKESERRSKISNSMKKNPKAGGLREGSGRGKKTWYNSAIAGRVYLRSSYELEYAKWLDANGIDWNQNEDKFPYQWEGTTKNYYPDFFLVKENIFVEIKGFATKKDLEKWKQFPHPLKVLYRKDLLLLGLNV